MKPVKTGSPRPSVRQSVGPFAVVAGLLLVFFLFDLVLPTGIASGVPYILPVLIALRLPGRAAPLVVAVMATVLTIVGYFLPPPNPVVEPYWIGLDNRLIAILAIWSTAILGYRFAVQDAEIRERETRLRTIVETTPDLIVILDSDGLIETCNASTTRTFHRPPTELIGRRLSELVGPAEPHSDGSLAPDASELFADGRSGSGLGSIDTGCAATRTVRWIVQPLEDSGRRLAVGHDMTELLDAQDRAVRSERLAAIGQTLATLSHESKNELLAIRFGLEQLGRCWEDPEATAEMISSLLESQNRVWRLFEDVRNYAAPIGLRPSRSSLPDVWRSAWSKVNGGLPDRNVRLIEQVSADASVCVVDPFRLDQVFRNLFENSLAATSDPVEVAIECCVVTWRGEPAVKVSVRDNGPGLSDDARARLFEPFFTTKPRGTGLGLSLSRRILEAHYGDLVAGPPGKGAEFVLYLPRNALTIPAEANTA